MDKILYKVIYIFSAFLFCFYSVLVQADGGSGQVRSTSTTLSCGAGMVGSISASCTAVRDIFNDSCAISKAPSGGKWRITSNTCVTANYAPVANNAALTVAADTSGTVTLNATDADGDSLSYTVVAAPNAAHGTVAISGNKATFKPHTYFSGTTSFTYRVSDGKANSNVATVTVTVQPYSACFYDKNASLMVTAGSSRSGDGFISNSSQTFSYKGITIAMSTGAWGATHPATAQLNGHTFRRGALRKSYTESTFIPVKIDEYELCLDFKPANFDLPKTYKDNLNFFKGSNRAMTVGGRVIGTASQVTMPPMSYVPGSNVLIK